MSVRKRTWETAEGEQRQAFLVDYRDQHGNRAFKTFAKKGDADSYWARVKVAVDAGDHVAPSKSETIAQVAERWIKRVKADGRERTTVRQYEQHVKHHINPKIGNLKIAGLTEARLEKFRDDLLADMSRALARKVLVSTKSILRTAKRAQIAANVRIPRDKRERKLEVGRDIPAPSEVKRLLEATEKTDLRRRALVATVVFTGLRASELRGLRWKDVDLKRAELHVRQRADRYKTIGAPKSETSVRTLDLGSKVIAILKEWKMACPKGEGDLVFPTAKGAVEDHKTMLRSLAPVMQSAGLVDKEGEPRYGLHSLRHYFASWCINPRSAGGRELPAKNVQQLMGHASIVLTLDLYSHLFPRGDDRAELATAEAALWG